MFILITLVALVALVVAGFVAVFRHAIKNPDDEDRGGWYFFFFDC